MNVSVFNCTSHIPNNISMILVFLHEAFFVQLHTMKTMVTDLNPMPIFIIFLIGIDRIGSVWITTLVKWKLWGFNHLLLWSLRNMWWLTSHKACILFWFKPLSCFSLNMMTTNLLRQSSLVFNLHFLMCFLPTTICIVLFGIHYWGGWFHKCLCLEFHSNFKVI